MYDTKSLQLTYILIITTYGVSWNNSQGENIKAYKYKWSQLGAVSVGFRVFFD